MSEEYSAGQIGLIVGRKFINNKAVFIEWFKKNLKDNEGAIKKAGEALKCSLNRLNLADQSDDGAGLAAAARDFYKKYQKFERVALGREHGASVQMGFRNREGQYYSLSNIEAEQYGEFTEKWEKKRNNFGIQNSVLYSNAQKAGVARQVENYILQHLNSMITMISDSGPNQAQYNDMKARQASDLVHFQRSRNSADDTWGYYLLADTTDKEGNYILKPQQSGQAYEAFFDHLAKTHQWVYEFLQSRGRVTREHLDLMTAGDMKTSVFVEEGGTTSQVGTFAHLFAKARGNNTPWFASGDIVIVNPTTGEVVYNIQLKSTKFHKSAGFAQRIVELIQFIDTFLNENSPEKKAELIWNDFKTSINGVTPVTEAIGRKALEDTDEIFDTLIPYGVKKT